jgi:hypothetical protein
VIAALPVRWRVRLLGALALIVLTVLSLGAYRLARTLPESPLFLSLGYVGVFLLTMSCSATLFLPVPAWGAVTTAGALLNPFLPGMAAGAGAATGELSAIPNPLFDVAGLTAGSLGYSPWRYWLAVAMGKSIVYIVLALGGQTLVPMLF